MAPTKDKRKHRTLNIKEKLEILDKLDQGKSLTSLALEYGVGRATVSDFKRQKAKIREFAKRHLPYDVKVTKVKDIARTMRTGKHKALDEATFKWWKQLTANGVSVRGVDILDAAAKLAKEMGITDFVGSDGWLWRFRRRHCLANRALRGEAASAPVAEIGPFRDRLCKIIKDEGLLLSQVYNMDETGLYWRSLPTNTQAITHARSQPGRKIDKSRISVLFGSNADGSHKLTPVVVGYSAKPRVLKDCMHDLPCHYYSSRKAWFTGDIFSHVFKRVVVPAIEKYQMQELKLSSDRVRAVILLDNAPAHPHTDELVALGGRVRALFLPPNTTSVIQPMDQGIIQATKMRYKRLFLKDVLVVHDEAEDEESDNRGLKTLENLKAYNLKSAIYNLSASWKAITQSTLLNAWNPLLHDKDDDIGDFKGFEVKDFKAVLENGGESGPSAGDVEEWLGEDEGDPGYEILSTREIAEFVLKEDE